MALVASYTHPGTGAVYPEAYIISADNVSVYGNAIKFSAWIFASAQAFADGKSHVDIIDREFAREYTVDPEPTTDGEDPGSPVTYGTPHLPTSLPIDSASRRPVLYALLATLPEFAGSEVVDES